jgi:hypothetical protein
MRVECVCPTKHPKAREGNSMNAPTDADGRRAASTANDEMKQGDRKSSDLDDAWFELPRRPAPGSAPYRRAPDGTPPPPLDDGLADEWFR